MRPSIGRIVIYVPSLEHAPQMAAVITTVSGDSEFVGLHVFVPPGLYGSCVETHSNVAHDEDKTQNSWHWPPRI